MNCEQVREQISMWLDGLLTVPEWDESQTHIRSCRDCDVHLEFMQKLRADMRSMARPAVPAALTDQLRVMASHEYARNLTRANLSALLQNWHGNIRLAFDNLMRPFAVPVTGGLFTALLLFSILVPSLRFRHSTAAESPIAVLNDPEGHIVGATYGLHVEPADATISGNETALVLLIDERGHVEGYYLSGGKLTDEMTNLILLSQFTPATASGQRTWGLTQVVFHHRRRMRS